MKAIIDGKRVTCEHCGSNDCAGIVQDHVVCCLTGKPIRGKHDSPQTDDPPVWGQAEALGNLALEREERRS
jgi:hypothetical protein